MEPILNMKFVLDIIGGTTFWTARVGPATRHTDAPEDRTRPARSPNCSFLCVSYQQQDPMGRQQQFFPDTLLLLTSLTAVG